MNAEITIESGAELLVRFEADSKDFRELIDICRLHKGEFDRNVDDPLWRVPVYASAALCRSLDRKGYVYRIV